MIRIIRVIGLLDSLGLLGWLLFWEANHFKESRRIGYKNLWNNNNKNIYNQHGLILIKKREQERREGMKKRQTAEEEGRRGN